MSKKVPGPEGVRTASVGSPGSHTDIYGIGATCLSLHIASKPNGPWIDLLEIWFQDMDHSRYQELKLDRDTTPPGGDFVFTERGKAFSDANRRLSRAQAFWLRDQLTQFIASLGHIPSDDDIRNNAAGGLHQQPNTYKVAQQMGYAYKLAYEKLRTLLPPATYQMELNECERLIADAHTLSGDQS